MLSGRAISPILALLVLLCYILKANAVLTQTEKDALSEILRTHPDLTSVPSWEVLDENNNYYGSSWNTSFDNLCQRDGYDFYGVYCLSGHVAGLRVTRHWGLSILQMYSASAQFTFLQNYTELRTSVTTSEFLPFLSSTLALQQVDAIYVRVSNFAAPSSLVSLSATLADSFTFANMIGLRYLKVNLDANSTNIDFPSLCGGSSLNELQIFGGDWTEFAALVNCLPALQQATFDSVYTNLRSNVGSTITSSSLKYLAISMFQATTDTLTINADSLIELSIQVPPNVNISLNAPNLKILRLLCNELPPNFSSLTQLESFYWSSSAGVPQLVPDMSFAPALRSFSLQSMSLANPNVNDIWNSLPSTIESISLGPFATLSGQIVLPSTWTSLRTVSIFSTSAGTFDEASIAQLHSIQEFMYQGVGFTAIDQFYSFPNLTKLVLLYFGSAPGHVEIPSDFFVRLNKLKELSVLGSNYLAGTIPWYGLENLESLSLIGRFPSWPSIQGSASNLHTLYMASPILSMIPTDAAFLQANLQKLRKFNLHAPTLRTTPFFWTNSSSISELTLEAKAYMGPLPSKIEAPRLKELSLNQNSFCGSLPDFTIPTHLNSISLSMNRLSGTIPRSWVDNLSVIYILNLSYNWLNGTIPADLMNHHMSFMGAILLENNDFTGPIWNMSSGTPRSLRIAYTGLDACTQDPDSRAGPNSTVCAINAVPTCPYQCPAFWELCLPFECYQQSFTPRAPPACQVPVVSCPLPQPGVGFECNQGTWIFLGDKSGGTITLPPSGGPVIIFGNLSTNGTITFSGTGTSIEVQGCVLDAPTQIVIELPADATPDSITLITQRGKNCTTDLSKVPIVLVSSDEDCKKRQISTTGSPTSLTAIFTIDDQCQRSQSSSKTKWIVLGSVLGGIVILLAALIAVLHVKSPAFRSFIRTCNLEKARMSK